MYDPDGSVEKCEGRIGMIAKDGEYAVISPDSERDIRSNCDWANRFFGHFASKALAVATAHEKVALGICNIAYVVKVEATVVRSAKILEQQNG